MAAAHHNRRMWLIPAAVIIVAAFAIRSIQFGNPLIQVDESFYLLVGDRMLHGALPYVDIWDRKPIGLFLIYAASRLLGGDGIIQYQVVATLFVAGTSLLIALMASRMAGRIAATAAAILYILLLDLIGGSGGQASVFYNLLVAGTALATLKAFETSSPARIRRLGCAAMLIMGLALQIKYTVVFEGLFFGLALLWRSWRMSRSIGRLSVDGLCWVLIALMPTVSAYAVYAANGHGDAFLYANFLSIGDRDNAPALVLLGRLARACITIGPPMIAVVAGRMVGPWREMPKGPVASGFVLAWLGAAVAGYLLFGTYANHYAIPLFVPIATATAPFFSWRRRQFGTIAAVMLLTLSALAAWTVIQATQDKRGDRALADSVTAAIRPRLTNCLYVWNGDPIYYHLTGSCLPGRHPFPSHLNLTLESQALGVDPIAELRHILANRPSVILDQQPRGDDFNPVAVAIVDAELRRAYRPAATFPLRESSVIVYERIKGR